MDVRLIAEDKDKYMDLLLLGDEQVNMIEKYLYVGDLYGLFDQDLKTLAVVTKVDEETYELKNLATYEKDHSKGYGTHMLNYIIDLHKDKCRKLIVGTGNSEGILSYYKKFGFTYSHTVKNFFVDNYNHEMFDDGVQLIDMIYLKLEYKR